MGRHESREGGAQVHGWAQNSARSPPLGALLSAAVPYVAGPAPAAAAAAALAAAGSTAPHLQAVVARVALHRLQLLRVQVEHALRPLHLLHPARCHHRRPPGLRREWGVELNREWAGASGSQQAGPEGRRGTWQPAGQLRSRPRPPEQSALPPPLAGSLTMGLRREGGSTCSVGSQKGSASRALRQAAAGSRGGSTCAGRRRGVHDRSGGAQAA